jgi:AcrR family transcriptional regulator
VSERLDRASWVEAGLAALADAGPGGIKIPAIARRLGVTKGSFYWHFRDLGDYEDALLAAWEQQYTMEVMRLVEESGGDAIQRLRRLVDLAFETDTKLARAIRHWSANDARARRAQGRADRERLTYIADLLRDLGWRETEAGALARWTYWAVIGLHAMKAPKPDAADIETVLRTLLPSSGFQSSTSIKVGHR